MSVIKKIGSFHCDQDGFNICDHLFMTQRIGKISVEFPLHAISYYLFLSKQFILSELVLSSRRHGKCVN